MDANETALTVAQIAEKLNVKTDTVRRLFNTEPGVIVLPSPARGRRTYRTVRIPPTVLLRVLTRLTHEHRWTLQDLDEPIFTPDQIAQTLKLDADTVRRLFMREPGVLVICFPRPATRTYRTLRVPQRVLANVIQRLSLVDAAFPPDPPSDVYSVNAAGTALIRSSSVQAGPHFPAH